MNWEAIKVGVEVALAAINAVVFFFMWNINRHKVTADQINGLREDLEKKMSDIQVQQGHFDERLKYAIGHTELKPIWEAINSMGRELSQVNGKMDTLDLIHEYLMRHGGTR